MSKLSFRARALDPSKPMPIYLADELPDLPEYSAINRAVPQMPSGMEKEEESVSIRHIELLVWWKQKFFLRRKSAILYELLYCHLAPDSLIFENFFEISCIYTQKYAGFFAFLVILNFSPSITHNATQKIMKLMKPAKL